MILKYMRKRNEKLSDDEDPFYTLEKEYLVLGVSFNSSGKEWMDHEVITLGDDIPAGAGGAPLKCFDIVDPRIPSNWIIEYGDFYNSYYLYPQEFQGDFWERYHDSDPEAERLFKEVYRDIQHFHGIEPPEPKVEKKPENPFYWSDKWLRERA